MTAGFRQLHYGDVPLVLPNAWDVPSALAFLEAGFVAVGTTSFGVAASRGLPDGARNSKQANAELARALTALDCLVSVDIEDGYADDPDEVADYVAHLDVAGINIEDSTHEKLIAPEVHGAKVSAVKRHCPEVFVNARVDSYWLGQDAEVGATLERAERYVAAGADGIFIPGVADEGAIRTLCARLDRPVNVLASPELPLTKLADLGVRRVSTGSLPYRAARHAATRAAIAVRDGAFLPDAAPYADMQARLLAYDRR
jgi:2-methylisocitrate lyase-like PEP mutase family enzyme